eukprot:TRINITY_DN25142_c0_g1_i1.p1 TRINITY_DN25142_c0_g1~~TRINITY_DN25142_c0_g1_i1.p1  ORF type:complete len:833 (+),score=160.38 TRINITY_DN25142_c0_g1_i1:304-2499(+)
MFYYNAQQIVENSEGEENLFRGDSDFRKLTQLLIFTWLPFPCWFALSEEGFGAVRNQMSVELGWVVLNITSKFSFIVVAQRMKMQHAQRLEATRELYTVPENLAQAEVASQNAGAAIVPTDGKAATEENLEERSSAKLQELVRDTMVTLSLSHHADRFLKVLVDNGITNTDTLERVTQDRALDMNLPWSLVDSVQRRWRAQKMRLAQEEHLETEDPFKMMLERNKQLTAKTQQEANGHNSGGGLPGQLDLENLCVVGPDGALQTGYGRQVSITGNEERFKEIEAKLGQLLEGQQVFLEALKSSEERSTEVTYAGMDKLLDSLCQRLDYAQVGVLQTVSNNQFLLHKLDSGQEQVMQKVEKLRDALDGMTSATNSLNKTIEGNAEESLQSLVKCLTEASTELLSKIEGTVTEQLALSQSTHGIVEQTSLAQSQTGVKTDQILESSMRHTKELQSDFEERLEKLVETIAEKTNKSLEVVSENLKADLVQIGTQSAAVVESTSQTARTQEERMVEMRRQNIMILDMLASSQEAITTSAASIQCFTGSHCAREENFEKTCSALETDMRELIVKQMNRLQQVLIGSDPAALSGLEAEGGLRGVLSSSAERLKKQVERLEEEKTDSSISAALEDCIRKEVSSIAEAIRSQNEAMQSAMGQTVETATHLGEVVRQELTQLQTTQNETMREKIDEFSGLVEKNMERFEEGIGKVLGTNSSDKNKGEKAERRQSSRNERG